MSKSTLETVIAIGGKLNPSLQKMFSSVSKYASSAGKSVNTINSTTSSVTQAVTSKLGSIESKIKAVITASTVAVAAKKVGSAMIDQASSMEQYRNTLNIVMKDNNKAAKTFQWAVQYANKTPFETGDIVDATVKLTSYGLEAKKVLPLAGDMAGAMGKPIDQAVEAIADAQTGELERLKEFGITKEMIVAQGAKKLSGIELVNNKGQITNQRAFNATLLSLMKDRYNGAMEVQSKTWDGLKSTVSGVVKNSLAKIAGISDEGTIVEGSAFDLLKDKLSGLSQKLTEYQSDGTIDAIADKFKDFTGSVADGIENAIPKVMQMFDFIESHGPQIENVAKGIGIAFVSWKVLNGIATVASTIGVIHTAIKGLASGLSFLSLAKMKDRVDTLYLIALYAKDAIVKGATTVATGAQAAAQWALNSAFLACPLTWIIVGIVALIAIFVLLWNKCEGFRNFFISMFQSIQAGIQTFDAWMTMAMTTDWTQSFGVLGNILNAFFSIVGSIWNSIKMIFSGIIDFVKGVFTGNWSLAWSGVVSIFGGIFSGIAAVAKAPLNAVIGLINAAISGLNKISVDIPSFVPGIGGKHFGVNIPSIPYLAKGGIASVPSICGEAGPEAVIPLKRNNPRSISLLEKTAAVVGGNKNSKPGHTFIFAPKIGGNITKEEFNELKQSYEKFIEMIEEYQDDEERVSFE